MYKVDYQESLKALRDQKVKVPCGASICKKCHDLLENEAEPIESQDMFEDHDEVEMSEPSQDSDYVLSQNQDEIVKAFKDFVQQTGENLDFEVSDVLSGEFEKYKDKMKLFGTL